MDARHSWNAVLDRRDEVVAGGVLELHPQLSALVCLVLRHFWYYYFAAILRPLLCCPSYAYMAGGVAVSQFKIRAVAVK
jgi:hypothetical protein